jgi:DNA-directed RNA polymerase subunit H (RpoH/RPB5)
MQIERVLLHLKEMLDMRGEDTIEFEEHGYTVPFQRYYNELVVLESDKTTVFFALKKEVLKDLQRDWKELDTAEKFTDAYDGHKSYILVLAEDPSTPAKNTFAALDKQLNAVGGMFQFFMTKELLYNPTKHELVPKHEKLSEDEVAALKERYMLKSKMQMPHILKTDVIARWLGLRHGDVVRIPRHNDTSGECYYYRYCV